MRNIDIASREFKFLYTYLRMTNEISNTNVKIFYYMFESIVDLLAVQVIP